MLLAVILSLSIEYVITYQILNFNGAIMPRTPHPITPRRFGMGLQRPWAKCFLNHRWQDCTIIPKHISSTILSRSQTKEVDKNKGIMFNRLFEAAQNHGAYLHDRTKSIIPFLNWPVVKFPHLHSVPIQKTRTDTRKLLPIKSTVYLSTSPSYYSLTNLPPESTGVSENILVKQENNAQLNPDISRRKFDESEVTTRSNNYVSSVNIHKSKISPESWSNYEIIPEKNNYKISSIGVSGNKLVTTTIKPPVEIDLAYVKQTFLERLKKIEESKSSTLSHTIVPDKQYPRGDMENKLTSYYGMVLNNKKQTRNGEAPEVSNKEIYTTPYIVVPNIDNIKTGHDILSSTQIQSVQYADNKKINNGHQNQFAKDLQKYVQTPENVPYSFIPTHSSSVSNKINLYQSTDNLRNKLKENKTINIINKNVEVEPTTETNREVLLKQRRKNLFEIFTDVLDNLERKFFATTFNKLTSISPVERRENGISFAQSGLYLSLLLIALSTETDDETRAEIDQTLGLNISDTEKVDIIQEVLSMLPQSTDELKFRWASRLVLGATQNVSEQFKCGAANALRMNLGKFYGNETDEALAKNLNHMVEQDSGGAIRDTFDPEEMSGGVRAVALTTLYVRGRWRAAPTVLNGTRRFRDAAPAPPRTSRMIRINDVMRYANLLDWHFHALEISYSTPGLSLLMLIPHDVSLRPLAARLATTSLREITRRMVPMRVAATMPLYTLRMTLLLPSKLQTMGITKLITNNTATDDGRLKLSHAVQRLMFWSEAGRNAFKDDGIEWDEPPELELVVDRPYLFFVRWHNITLMSGNFAL